MHIRNLSCLCYGQGFTHWHYRTTDAAVTVAATGYFSDARDMIRRGDLLTCNVSRGCIQLWVADVHPQLGVLTEVMCATHPAVASIEDTL